MADAALSSVVRYIRRTAGRPEELTDGQLLDRFIRRHDEAAFTTLVQRHGPMVLGVCRRLLDRDAAEDAFQATWLVLLDRAHSIRKREALGSWLYGVAYRTALKARATAARRGLLERPLLHEPAAPAISDLAAAELRAELDAEVNRLARRYRTAVVLCYFQNKTYAEAAQILGIAAGTLASRLARARELLRTRLTRRGLTLSAGLLATLLGQDRLTAAVPGTLLESSRLAVSSILAGKPWTAVVPAQILSLTKGVLKNMFLTRLITIAAVLILLGVAGAGARLVSTAAAARQADDQQQPAAELQALRVELQEAKQQIQQLKEALRLAQQSSRQTRPRLYRGKPISYWIEQLSDGDPSYRKEAVTVLGVISRDDRSAIDPLLGALRDKDETVRYEAAYSLGRADASAIPSLTALLKEQGEMQRLAAVALSYHAREAKSAIPALIDALKSRDREARKAVARTLMLMGPMARETVPALIQALKVDLNMQGEVFQALGQIEPEAQEILPRRFFDPDTKYAAESSKQIEELKRDWQKAIEKLERKYPPRPIKP